MRWHPPLRMTRMPHPGQRWVCLSLYIHTARRELKGSRGACPCDRELRAAALATSSTPSPCGGGNVILAIAAREARGTEHEEARNTDLECNDGQLPARPARAGESDAPAEARAQPCLEALLAHADLAAGQPCAVGARDRLHAQHARRVIESRALHRVAAYRLGVPSPSGSSVIGDRTTGDAPLIFGADPAVM